MVKFKIHIIIINYLENNFVIYIVVRKPSYDLGSMMGQFLSIRHKNVGTVN